MQDILKAVTAILLGIISSPFFAADNQREIDAIAKEYTSASEKADQIRERSMSDARSKATLKLTKLAERAFKDGDRSAEINAWRAILAIDSENDRARKYFSDLGTLDKEMAALPTEGGNKAAAKRALVGKWRLHWNSGNSIDVSIAANGTLTYGNGITATVSQRSADSIIVPVTALGVDRYTLAGDMLLIESWAPPASFDPTTAPKNFGYATRQPK